MSESILLISFFAPCRGHAGGLRLLDLYRQIRLIKPSVYLELVACRHKDIDWGWGAANTIFDRIHWLAPNEYNYKTVEQLGVFSRSFDIIDLQYHRSGKLVFPIKKFQPQSLVLFSPMESMVRGWQLLVISKLRSGFGCFVKQSLFALQEVIYARRADAVVCVSNADRVSLQVVASKASVFCIPTGISQYEFNDTSKKLAGKDSFGEQKNNVIVFAAFFGSETNRDALSWFVGAVHPLIALSVPDYCLDVIGRGIDEMLKKECDVQGVNIIGEVESLGAELIYADIGIAPALSGAGVRGKVHQYAHFGLPCVASPLAVDGLAYESGKSIHLAEDAQTFASKCITLLTNDVERRTMGEMAQRVCKENYTWMSISHQVRSVYKL